MNTPLVNIRPASPDDLDGINRVVEAAVMTWQLPERVKRLSLPSYRYNVIDLSHLQLAVAIDASGTILGVAAWEPAEPQDCPRDKTGLLLHGLYVDPTAQRKGIGSALFDKAVGAAREAGLDGLLTKAQSDAMDFYTSQGMLLLPVEDQARHYANRMWKPVSDSS